MMLEQTFKSCPNAIYDPDILHLQLISSETQWKTFGQKSEKELPIFFQIENFIYK